MDEDLVYLSEECTVISLRYRPSGVYPTCVKNGFDRVYIVLNQRFLCPDLRSTLGSETPRRYTGGVMFYFFESIPV